MKTSDSSSEGVEDIRTLLHDPVAQLLLKNSNLTRVQFETFVIDSMWRQLADTAGTNRPKHTMRQTRGRISRGAFNRSLIQAQNNVIRAIYTVFLLGYAGLFDSPKLEPFMEVADQIRTFVESRHTKETSASKETLALLANSLRIAVGELAARKSFLERL